MLAPPPHEVVDWIAAHAIALSTTEAGHGLDDIAPIARIVGKARIVALGEATHGTREFFQLKHRVLEYRSRGGGFTVFAIEANQPECRAINDYVLHGTGDPKAGLDGIYFWTWNTEEVLAMIEWMRAWNADAAHQQGPVPRLRHADLARRTRQRRRVPGQGRAGRRAGAGRTARGAEQPDRERRGRQAPATTIASASATGSPRSPARSTATAKRGRSRPARRSRRRLATTSRSCSRPPRYLESAPAAPATASNVRDRSMAANVQWILDHQPAGTRMVVWAHNGHIANQLGGLVNMGSQLRKQFKTGYVNFGFVFSQGSFQAIQMQGGSRGSLNEISLGEPPESHASVAFARTDKPVLVLDLRAIPGKGIVHD